MLMPPQQAPVDVAASLVRHALEAYGKPHPASPEEAARLQQIAIEQGWLIEDLSAREMGAVAIIEASITAGAIIELAAGLDMDPQAVLEEIIRQAKGRVDP